MGNTVIHACPPSIQYLLGEGGSEEAAPTNSESRACSQVIFVLSSTLSRPLVNPIAWIPVCSTFALTHTLLTLITCFDSSASSECVWCRDAVSKHIQNVLLIWRTDCATNGTHYRAPFAPLAVDAATEFSAHECYLLLHLRDTDPSPPPPPPPPAADSDHGGASSSASSSSSVSSSSASASSSAAASAPSWMLVDESVLHLLTSLAATIEPRDLVTPVNPRALVLVLPRARRSLRYFHIFMCGFFQRCS